MTNHQPENFSHMIIYVYHENDIHSNHPSTFSLSITKKNLMALLQATIKFFP